jgi:hypothetical protein
MPIDEIFCYIFSWSFYGLDFSVFRVVNIFSMPFLLITRPKNIDHSFYCYVIIVFSLRPSKANNVQGMSNIFLINHISVDSSDLVRL